MKSVYHFRDRPKEDLFKLCESYLNKLDQMVREWIQIQIALERPDY